jgi:hypothetical protein
MLCFMIYLFVACINELLCDNILFYLNCYIIVDLFKLNCYIIIFKALQLLFMLNLSYMTCCIYFHINITFFYATSVCR